MAFNTDDKKISGILEKRVYMIPRNQRRYVWKEDNWKDLLEDMDFSISDAKRAHFMGSIVLEKCDSGDKGEGIEVYSIIDGQQRITTFLLFLSSIMYIFKERSLQASFEGLKSYLITTNLVNKEFCKLTAEHYPSLEIFVQNVCNWKKSYSSITKLVAESSNASKQNKDIFDAVYFFYEKLSKLTTEEVEAYRNALLRTSVVEIIATSEEDAYTIFEILNARGQILEDFELIKNFIMRYYEPSDNVDKAKERWNNEIIRTLGDNTSQFIKHYVTHRYAKSGNGHNFNYDVLKAEIGKHEVIQLLDDLCRKASYYKIIIDPQMGDDGNCSECEYNVYSFMKSNRGMLFRPMFLSLIQRNKTGEISDEVYFGVLELIKYFFICYNLLGRLTSNKLTDTVQGAAKVVSEEYTPDSLKKFVSGLCRRLPTQEEFTKSFQSIGWSKINEYHKDISQKRRAQIALETLESIETGSWKMASYTIEHLNPDTEDRKNANIGNLVLLEEAANRNNADKAFKDKVDSYQDSCFKTARNVYKHYHEKPDTFDINVRAEKMAEVIYKHIKEKEINLLTLLNNRQ